MRNAFDGTVSDRIRALGRRVLGGGRISRDEALFLFHLESTADIFDLLAWANRIREHFKGNQVHLCSIVNAKAGGCSENCKFCSQSAAYQTESPRYGFVDPEPALEAAAEAGRHQVTALGLVAAWKGLNEGPMLDEVCDRVRELKAQGQVRVDVSLGIIKSPTVAERLKAAGVECYGHNLESSRRFFPEHCSTHSFEDRLQTIRHLKDAGIRICSGGIIGMGESREDRCDLALELREIGANVVPINFLNPIEGTPFRKAPSHPSARGAQDHRLFPVPPPTPGIMVAGGRTKNLRDLQSMIFAAGASALMVGNYLTTLNRPVEEDLKMIADLGLNPSWDHHFEDQDEASCDNADRQLAAAMPRPRPGPRLRTPSQHPPRSCEGAGAPPNPMNHEVQDFEKQVLQRSRQVPVVVDFWAPWCGPCKMLGPVIEGLARASGGKWDLVKVNTEEQQALAMAYNIASIPAVKMFKDGVVADEFVGSLPEDQIRRWIEKHIPSPAQEEMEKAAEFIDDGRLAEARALLEQALAKDPDRVPAKILLAEILLGENPAQAADLLDKVPEHADEAPHAQALALLARAALRTEESLPDDPVRARLLEGLAAIKSRDWDTALAALVDVVERRRGYADNLATDAGKAIFRYLGVRHPIADKYYRRFSSALNS